jgi:hypothetical protein
MARQRVNGAESTDGGLESGDVPVSIVDPGVIIEADGTDGIPTVDPASLTAEAEGEPGKRKRGRPAGSKNATGKSTTKEVSEDLTSILYSLHAMGAAMLKTPELELTPDEAERLGKAVNRVNREYGNIVMPPKTAATINLLIVAGGIYGPRLIAIRNNKKKGGKGPVTVQ